MCTGKKRRRNFKYFIMRIRKHLQGISEINILKVQSRNICLLNTCARYFSGIGRIGFFYNLEPTLWFSYQRQKKMWREREKVATQRIIIANIQRAMWRIFFIGCRNVMTLALLEIIYIC